MSLPPRVGVELPPRAATRVDGSAEGASSIPFRGKRQASENKQDPGLASNPLELSATAGPSGGQSDGRASRRVRLAPHVGTPRRGFPWCRVKKFGESVREVALVF